MRASRLAVLQVPPVFGPLDLISGAVAACGFRRLWSGYSSPLINLRRSSDNAQRDFYALPNGDLDVGSVSAWLGAANGFITKAYDQSGNGNDVSQATAANQPQLVLNAQNGRPGVLFSGAQSLVTGAVSYSTPITMAAVGKRTGAFTSYADLIGTNSGVIGTRPFLGFSNAANTALLATNNFITGSASDNAAHTIAGILTASGAGENLYVDGAAISGSTTAATSATAIYLGNDINGLGLTGYVFEAIFANSLWAASQIAAVQTNQKAYWGTP